MWVERKEDGIYLKRFVFYLIHVCGRVWFSSIYDCGVDNDVGMENFSFSIVGYSWL